MLGRLSVLLLASCFVASIWACESDDVDPQANGTDSCTPSGYMCQSQALCGEVAGYMPREGLSCGAPGMYCCMKGALPPGSDASADGAASDGSTTDDCTPSGYLCQSQPLCGEVAGYMPIEGISCGSPDKYCCMKGALAPGSDASDQ